MKLFYKKKLEHKPCLQKKKPSKKSGFRRVNDWLHLWLGLISGIVVFIISITGCIYVFEKEIRSFTQSYQFVEARNLPMKPPSVLKSISKDFVQREHGAVPTIFGINYPGKGKAAIAAYSDKDYGYTMVYMDPYNGKVLHEKILSHDFFRIVLMGHFYFWLPPAIGQPFVASSVLIFVVLLISGLIMWWPKNLKKSNVNKSFKIKWKASFKRVNYDLHNVLGFYALVFALVLSLTGLVWGFQWFKKAYFFTLTAGQSLEEVTKPSSDSTLVDLPFNASAEDMIWQQMKKEYPDPNAQIQVEFAHEKTDPIRVIYNPNYGTYYKRQFRFFDQYSLEEIQNGGGVYQEKFEEASVGEKIYRMNYDIHVGAIAGLPGKTLAFFVSLICASLPVTGFLVWWGRKKKKAKKKKKGKPQGSPYKNIRSDRQLGQQKSRIPVS
ncbi:PepSY-associated TM helix domain-containing protein [Echinicola jeungdonensis]|uniref:PepSY-associated TM helix domain-containing protein n=1 Tax=Echinicola jeungdonensis TaxID=709343 RepID=A0ABV5J2K7_9BACT|nr:PepSY-associated TM helix domain-containing protein [Echinicola jeungdonensis]MDN3671042.1 PepSY-associated TM helix domain-containing protein [Echinicola jeungdonensis]